MRAIREITAAGFAAVLLHPSRSSALIAALLVVLVPYLVAIGISQGVQREAEISVQSGADLYVSGLQFGQPAPLPRTAMGRIAAIDGVERVTPRIVGSVFLGKNREPAVVVGMPADALTESSPQVIGRLARDNPSPELVLGSQLAQRLGLQPGDAIPPFYRNPAGERVSQIVGVFHDDVTLWQANVMLTTLESAEVIFARKGQATDLLVTCRPGYMTAVQRAILELRNLAEEPDGDPLLPRVVSREHLQAILPRDLLHREGLFNLQYCVALVVGILVMLAASGLGMSERRREIGVLRATGWQIGELMLRGLAESVTLSLLAATIAILIAYVWLVWGNGYLIASIFLPGVDARPAVRVPFYLTPLAVFVAYALALAVVLVGTLLATWRSATVSPREALR